MRWLETSVGSGRRYGQEATGRRARPAPWLFASEFVRGSKYDYVDTRPDAVGRRYCRLRSSFDSCAANATGSDKWPA
jgi:hypothetical protein